jgi:NTE family protein
VVFVECADALPEWGGDQTVEPRATELDAAHALASAAVPFIFPPVRIGHEFHCDGGLRQNVPLSPARRLGADGVLVVNPRYLPPRGAKAITRPEPIPGALGLFGKTLNALMLDRIDNDLDRLRRINEILDAGIRHYGDELLEVVNREMGRDLSARIRPLRTVLIRATQDIGQLAVEYVRSRTFSERSPSVVKRLMRRLASDESDLLSYLLFDGEFAHQLIELGRADARARHDELCAFAVAMAEARAPT